MKLVKRMIDDITKNIIEVWDNEKIDIPLLMEVSRNYYQGTHHIDQEVANGSEEAKEDKEEDCTQEEKPWEAYKGGCAGCKGCSGIGERLK
jgi:hypothetical protein